MEVGIHNLTHNPTQAWTELSKSQRVLKINARPPKTGVAPNKVRIVCMSDTHSLTSHIKFEVPNGDIFIHAGDFTRCGSLEEIVEFNEWLGNLPHKHKIVIAGNHELSLDENFIKNNEKNLPSTTPTLGLSRNAIAEAIRTPNAKQYLTNCTYLQDEEVTIYGIKIYGTPWQPEYCNWAFNLPRGKPCLSKWDLIPEDTDILISHTPPIGHGDLCCTGVRAGCVELLTTVQQRVKPKYHVFGHIHEGKPNARKLPDESTMSYLYT
ncbi:Metallophosphoesterase domain-containing protein 1 [Frankliniella fusca]|uniref:Metallophosphoesterase domain-containing protein 1 n=1 Tax=Frankliniella fusca TaxID=407009 RepID=A0AAE1HNN3_9NEOP|nr:Metallophosphoesterase domain-containing protein 1 [Frankliniella fusca]